MKDDPSFVHLHVHSNYSFCRGGNSLDELFFALRKQGQNVVALTEIDGLHGVVWAWQKAQEFGIRLIVGAEVRDATQRAVLLVKNSTGYENLCLLISQRHAEGEAFSLPEALPCRRDGLVILSDSEALLQRLAQNSRDGLFVLCVPGQQRRAMLRLSQKMQLPPVASNDVYFVAPQDYQTHRILRAIDCNVALSRIPAHELVPPSAWLKTAAEMAAAFPDALEALANTAYIAGQCRFELKRAGWLFPRFPTPNGEDEMTCLRALCLQGIRWRYGEMTDAIAQRLEKELGIIENKAFASHFLVVWDVVRHASQTCGRGSAAASLVSYVLGITHVDPLKHDLFFERFLHVAREDPPDIDVDFAWDERDAIIHYLYQKYGTAHTAMVSNHVTFKARAAVREIAKCYGFCNAEINHITKKLSGFSIRSVAASVKTHPLFRGVDLPAPWPEIIRMADRIAGFPRHLSVHCGGVVITSDGIAGHIPVVEATKGVQIIQVEKDQAEELGLVKLDILGNRSLAVIRDAVQAVKKNSGIEIDFNRVKPEDDAATQQLIKTGDTIGVFYVESPAMRLLQKKTGTGDFARLVVHSSIIRPASNAFIREYVRRLHGNPYEPLHPLLDDLLSETFGILSYQEDISRVAMTLADFNVVDADGLRKVFNKKNNEKQLAHYRGMFFGGARNKGIAQEVIEKIWDMILSFSGYSFCKPHSASYALVSYKSAYLRAHFPAEFMAAVISNQGGFYSTFAYISEARRMGLRILPADVNHSEQHYTGGNGAIRVGFMQLKGLGSAAVQAILAARQQGGLFRDFDDFVTRAQPEPVTLEILIKGGAFDALTGTENRPQLLWRALRQRAAPNVREQKRSAGQTTLFDAPKAPAAAPVLPPFQQQEMWRQEIETLGFLLSRHPLTLYRDRIRAKRLVAGKDLPKYAGKRVRTLGWFVTGKLVNSKAGEPMEFISFEDTTAIYETTFFPKAYDRFCHLLARSRPFLLSGKVEKEYDAITLTVDHVELV